jgi:hypothetical protein
MVVILTPARRVEHESWGNISSGRKPVKKGEKEPVFTPLLNVMFVGQELTSVSNGRSKRPSAELVRRVSPKQ